MKTTASASACSHVQLAEAKFATKSSFFVKKVFLNCMLLLCALIVGSSSVWAANATSVVNFESELATYTDWEFTDLTRTTQESIGSGTPVVTNPHAGSYFAKTSLSTGSWAVTKNKVSAPVSLVCYYTKCSSNTNANSLFKIQVSTDGSSWTDVASGKTMDNVTGGTWEELSANLSSYNNVYVRVFYKGTTAVRALDDITLTYIASSSPSITLSGSTFKHTKDAVTDGAINVTYNNITDVAAELQYFEEDGTTPATYSWLNASLNASNNVQYTIPANTGSSRKAYMKVYALDDESNDVYSPLITISQASGIVQPTISPDAGAIDAGTSITISHATATSIRYTLDGSDPTITTGEVYSTPITLTTAKTIKAIAIIGEDVSDVATAEYTINVAAPTFSVEGGSSLLQGSTFTLTSTGNTIYYTTNNSTPDNNSNKYTTSVEILSGTKTYKAIAYDTYGNASSVVSRNLTGITPVSLPFGWDKGTTRATVNGMTGVKQTGLDGDYSDNDYKLKFNTNNDNIIFYTDEKPVKMTIGVKMIGGGNTSKFSIQESTNGAEFTEVEQLTISGSQNTVVNLETSKDFATTTRVIKMNFIKGDNVGVGDVTITAANRTITLSSDCTDGTGKYYATYSCNKAFIVPADLTVSAVKITDGHLDLSATYSTGDVVAANTGVLISSATAGEKTVVLSSEAGTTKDGNLLHPGGVTDEEMAELYPNCKYYKLALERDGESFVANTAGFYWGADQGAAFTSGANKAYLAVPTTPSNPTAPSAFRFTDEENNATSINDIEASDKAVKFIENGRILIKKNGIVYDALGRIVK